MPLAACIWSFCILSFGKKKCIYIHITYIHKYLKFCRNKTAFFSWQHKTFSLDLDANKFGFICPVFSSEFDMVLVFGVYIKPPLFLDGLPSSSQKFPYTDYEYLMRTTFDRKKYLYWFRKIINLQHYSEWNIKGYSFQRKTLPEESFTKSYWG